MGAGQSVPQGDTALVSNSDSAPDAEIDDDARTVKAHAIDCCSVASSYQSLAELEDFFKTGDSGLGRWSIRSQPPASDLLANPIFEGDELHALEEEDAEHDDHVASPSKRRAAAAAPVPEVTIVMGPAELPRNRRARAAAHLMEKIALTAPVNGAGVPNPTAASAPSTSTAFEHGDVGKEVGADVPSPAAAAAAAASAAAAVAAAAAAKAAASAAVAAAAAAEAAADLEPLMHAGELPAAEGTATMQPRQTCVQEDATQTDGDARAVADRDVPAPPAAADGASGSPFLAAMDRLRSYRVADTDIGVLSSDGEDEEDGEVGEDTAAGTGAVTPMQVAAAADAGGDGADGAGPRVGGPEAAAAAEQGEGGVQNRAAEEQDAEKSVLLRRGSSRGATTDTVVYVPGTPDSPERTTDDAAAAGDEATSASPPRPAAARTNSVAEANSPPAVAAATVSDVTSGGSLAAEDAFADADIGVAVTGIRRDGTATAMVKNTSSGTAARDIADVNGFGDGAEVGKAAAAAVPEAVPEQVVVGKIDCASGSSETTHGSVAPASADEKNLTGGQGAVAAKDGEAVKHAEAAAAGKGATDGAIGLKSAAVKKAGAKGGVKAAGFGGLFSCFTCVGAPQ